MTWRLHIRWEAFGAKRVLNGDFSRALLNGVRLFSIAIVIVNRFWHLVLANLRLWHFMEKLARIINILLPKCDADFISGFGFGLMDLPLSCVLSCRFVWCCVSFNFSVWLGHCVSLWAYRGGSPIRSIAWAVYRLGWCTLAACPFRTCKFIIINLPFSYCPVFAGAVTCSILMFSLGFIGESALVIVGKSVRFDISSSFRRRNAIKYITIRVDFLRRQRRKMSFKADGKKKNIICW